MLEGRVGAQLEHEAPREADVARHAGPDGPNCDAAVQARMLGLINRAQAVGVQLAQQAIGADVLVTVALRLAAVLGLRAVLVRGFLSHET